MQRMNLNLNRSSHFVQHLLFSTKMSRISLAIRKSIVHKRVVEKISLSLTAIVDKYHRDGSLHDRVQKNRRRGLLDRQKEAKFLAIIDKKKNISPRDIAKKKSVLAADLLQT